jgi:hypothetical protein
MPAYDVVLWSLSCNQLVPLEHCANSCHCLLPIRVHVAHDEQNPRCFQFQRQRNPQVTAGSHGLSVPPLSGMAGCMLHRGRRGARTASLQLPRLHPCRHLHLDLGRHNASRAQRTTLACTLMIAGTMVLVYPMDSASCLRQVPALFHDARSA